MIVENNRIFREAFKESFYNHFPFIVIEEAANGDEALQKISGVSPHLIFMDIRLPGVNGLQLTQKVKTDFPDVNIAILTNYDLPEYRQAATQYGANRYFLAIFQNLASMQHSKW